MAEPARGRAEHVPDTPSRLSHVVAAVSGTLVLALAAYLVWRVFTPVPPATLTAAVAEAEVRSTAGGWVVPVDVRNDGGAAAKEVIVEAEAQRSGGAARLVATSTVDYLAGGEEQRVYAVFAEDPRAERLVARVRSWQEP